MTEFAIVKMAGEVVVVVASVSVVADVELNRAFSREEETATK